MPTARPLFDAHNHAHDAWLEPHLAQIDHDLSAAGVAGAVVNGTCEADWPIVAELATRYAWVRPSYGLHPWDAGNRTPAWLDTLRARLASADAATRPLDSSTSQPLSSSTPIIRTPVGEIGLDRWILDRARPDDPRLEGLRRAPLDEQQEVCIAQLALAVADNRPVTLHCLDAWGAIDTLTRTYALPHRGFLLHAYGGSTEMIAPFAERGAYFSFNTAFVGPRYAARREVFRHVPLDRLLVETDAPAMSPPPESCTRTLPPAPDGSPINHPANLALAYNALAELRGIPLEELVAQVAQNFHRLFG